MLLELILSQHQHRLWQSPQEPRKGQDMRKACRKDIFVDNFPRVQMLQTVCSNFEAVRFLTFESTSWVRWTIWHCTVWVFLHVVRALYFFPGVVLCLHWGWWHVGCWIGIVFGFRSWKLWMPCWNHDMYSNRHRDVEFRVRIVLRFDWPACCMWHWCGMFGLTRASTIKCMSCCACTAPHWRQVVIVVARALNMYLASWRASTDRHQKNIEKLCWCCAAFALLLMDAILIPCGSGIGPCSRLDAALVPCLACIFLWMLRWRHVLFTKARIPDAALGAKTIGRPCASVPGFLVQYTMRQKYVFQTARRPSCSQHRQI